MSNKIYLPEKLVLGQEEKDLYPYHRRVSNSFCIAFTLNESIQMYTGNKYTDSLDACLTAISWVEDNYCEYETTGIGNNIPNHDRIVKTCTIYMDRGGYIVSGHFQEMKYSAHSIDNNMPKKNTLIHNFRRKFLSGTKDNLLHKEIFINKVFNIESFSEFKINPESEFFKLLQQVSIYNRSMEMSFVYSIAQEKKIQLDNFKKIVGFVSIPITIEAYAWVKALQGGISLINYLCTTDDVMKLSDNLFEFRGPLVISDVFITNFINRYFDTQKGIIPKPKKEDLGVDLRNDTIKKQSALNDFIEIKTLLREQIKKIKEPDTEIK
ncbi:hypothetical protein [Chryseobacterium sp. MYb328]|uniref:hypothetical protein n=1 Tax=Chryseobacterium sp. MYb328 TaxID=2745231 RepID=UPI0030B2D54A